MELNVKKAYLIFDIVKSTTRDGRPFLKMVMSDDKATLVNAIMFDSNKLDFDPQRGDMVRVTANLQQYNEHPQLKVSDMEYISSGGEEAFMPKSKHDPELMAAELEQLFAKHVKNEWLSQLYKKFFTDTANFDRFKRFPAAKGMHHAYLNGLLEHTLGVCRLAVQVSLLYPQLNKELLLIGALFHDVGKIEELETSGGFDYSEDGKLLGHLLLGYTLVNGYMSEIDNFPPNYRQQILHMIASHHGYLEFGSPQVPKTADAIMLHFIDDMDAKMNAVDSIFSRDGVEDGGWSTYDRLLARQLFKTY